MEDASLSKRPLGLTRKYYNECLKESIALEYKDDSTFWVPIRSLNEETGKLEE